MAHSLPAASASSPPPTLVVRRVRDWLADPATILQALQHPDFGAINQKRLIERARDVAAGEIDGLHTFMRSSIVRVQVHVDRIDVILNQGRVWGCLVGETRTSEPGQARPEGNDQTTTLCIPAHLRRTGNEMRIVVGEGSEPATPNDALVRLLVRANSIRDQLLADRSRTFEDIAKAEGVVPSYTTRLFRLTLLAPDIVSAILSGKHPPELTARRLMDDTRLPLDWNEQRHYLGFAP